MMHCPIPRLQSDSSITASSGDVSRLRLAHLLGLLLLLPLRPVQGQSQQELGCTIDPRPILPGLPSPRKGCDGFGAETSLSQDGTIAAIGAPYFGFGYDGYVQVFRFENNSWMPLGSFSIFEDPNTETSTNALSDDGLILAVGGGTSMNIRVFRLVNDDFWEPLGNNITHPTGKDIGEALAISGDGTILAASALLVGEVRVFELVGRTWGRKGRTLRRQGEEQNFGESITLPRWKHIGSGDSKFQF